MFQPFGFNRTSVRKGAITVTNAAHIVTNYADCLHVPSVSINLSRICIERKEKYLQK